MQPPSLRKKWPKLLQFQHYSDLESTKSAYLAHSPGPARRMSSMRGAGSAHPQLGKLVLGFTTGRLKSWGPVLISSRRHANTYYILQLAIRTQLTTNKPHEPNVPLKGLGSDSGTVLSTPRRHKQSHVETQGSGFRVNFFLLHLLHKESLWISHH